MLQVRHSGAPKDHHPCHKLVLDILCDSWGVWLAKPHTLVVPREGFMGTLTPEHFDPCWLSRCM